MEPAMAEMPNGFPARPASYDKKVGLVLQGGGALGSYQAGVYEALASSEYLPDWVAGISIGAINAALIAGNRSDDRLKHLRAFWNEITSHTGWWPDGLSWPFAAWQRQASALMAVMYGQPGFFAPRQVYDWFRRIKASAITIRRLSKARWSNWSTSNGSIKRKTFV
jgi:NTE family protein